VGDPGERLRRLTEECLLLLGQDLGEGPRPGGSGVWIAPGLVLTCAHVLPAGLGGTVWVRWHGRELVGTVTDQIPGDRGDGLWQFPDLAVVEVPDVGVHPCVWLSDGTPVDGRSLMLFGHSGELGEGLRPTSFLGSLSGWHDFGPGRFWQFKGNEVIPGMSGGPVLDLVGGAVCALVSTTIGEGADRGGYLVPLDGLAHLPQPRRDQLLAASRRFHDGDGRWAEARGALDRAQRSGRTQDVAGRALWMVPERTGMVVDRPELMSVVVSAVTADDDVLVGITTAIEGAGGFGKTTLAGEVARHRGVRDRFPGGVLWVTVGARPRGPELAALINGVCEAVSGRTSTASDPMISGALLGALLSALEPTLLIIDDVWRHEQLAPFLIGGVGCRRLVTTRIAGVVRSGQRVLVDQMTPDEARQILIHGLDPVPRAVERRLLAWTGHWPVLLGLVNGALLDLVGDGAPIEQAASWVERRLASSGPASFDDPAAIGDTSERWRAVSATMSASLDLLTESEQDRYRELAIFPDGSNVASEVLRLLWSDSGLDNEGADALRTRLVRLRLATGGWTDDQPSVRLHDVLRAYLRRQLGEAAVASASRRFLARARQSLLPPDADPAEWWQLPSAGAAPAYLWRNLAYHLAEAGPAGDIDGTVCDLRWIEAKTTQFGSTVPIEADLAQSSSPTSAALTQAIGREAHMLAPIEPAGAFAATLASRLQHLPALRSVVASYVATLARPRLEPHWPLPDHSHPALRRTLSGHAGPAYGVAFAPGGEVLASAGVDQSVLLWHISTGAIRTVLRGHAGPVWTVAFAPDGETLASGGCDGTIRLWSTSDGAQLHRFRWHSESVWSVAFSPDGTLLASADDDRVVITEIAGGQVWDDCAYEIPRRSVAFAPDGRSLAVGGAWGSDAVVVRSLADGATIRLGRDDVAGRRGRDHVAGNSIAFSPDGSLLAAADLSRKVRVWDVATGAMRAAYPGHLKGGVAHSTHGGGTVTAVLPGVCFAPDGTTIATACGDETVRVRRVSDGNDLAVLTGHSDVVNGVAFSPDGTMLASASADGTVRLWSTGGLEAAGPTENPVRDRAVVGLDVSTNGAQVVAITVDGLLRLHTFDDGSVLHMMDRSATSRTPTIISKGITRVNLPRPVRLSADGAYCTLSDDKSMVVGLFRLTDGELARAFHGLGSPTYALTFSPDGRLLAAAEDDGKIHVWNNQPGPRTRRRERTDNLAAFTLAGHRDNVWGMSFSPDGALLASGDDDGVIKAWSIPDGAQIATFTDHDGPVWSVAFSPNGSRLASAGHDETVRLWSLTGAEQSVVLNGHTGPIRDVAFSPDGTYLASVSNDRVVRIWRAGDGTCLTALLTAAPLYCCAWHPHKNVIFAGGVGGVYALRFVGFELEAAAE